MIALAARLVTALTLATPVLAPAPAHASTEYVYIAAGAGTLDPGLTLFPRYQNVFWMADQIVLVATDGRVVLAAGCRFIGASLIRETTIEGKGVGTLGACTSGGITGSIHYERSGQVVTLSGTVTVAGQAYGMSVSLCHLTPTSSNPIWTYYLTCSGMLA